MRPLPEVLEFYDRFPEESRLDIGAFRLEFERTKEILSRILPPPPARVVDVGGASGAYSAWLAARGYETHLVDASSRLVAEARRRNPMLSKPIASLTVADARALPQPDGFATALLLMGPLYHLPRAEDRHTALLEAYRVLEQSGTIVVAAISRYASTLDGLTRKLSLDPEFVRIRDQDLADGHHRNETGNPDYFTTAYFHRPEDLHGEIERAGFHDVEVFGVEGPGWLLGDFDARWSNDAQRADIMNVARALECEASILGSSAHLMGRGHK